MPEHYYVVHHVVPSDSFSYICTQREKALTFSSHLLLRVHSDSVMWNNMMIGVRHVMNGIVRPPLVYSEQTSSYQYCIHVVDVTDFYSP